MFTTLDQWLARLFGANRRDGLVPPLAQRASYGHDGMNLQQIESYGQSFDFDDESQPYQPYLRPPRSGGVLPEPQQPIRVETPQELASQELAPQEWAHQEWAHQELAPPPVAAAYARQEAEATLKSQQMLRGYDPAGVADLSSSWAEPSPEFFAPPAAPAPERPVDPGRVRFTRTPEALLQRKREEEEAKIRAAEDEARRIEEEARLRAEDELRRAEEIRQARAEAMRQQTGEDKPRVRFARTPDAPLPPRAPQAAPLPEPQAEPQPLFMPAPFTAMGARFALRSGYAAPVVTAAPVLAPIPAPAPAFSPAPAEEPASVAAGKVRVRVKAAGRVAEAETAAPAPVAAPAARRPAPTAPGGFLQRLDPFSEDYEPFDVDMLSEPPFPTVEEDEDEVLEVNADALEKTLEDFGVRGDVLNAHPGPVVTLYEFEPAPGIKSSRVIGLADDIARSMSAVSARVAVVPGRNAIGIELPNPRRETVYLRELLATPEFSDSKHRLAIALGKTIGGEPVIVDLAKMPHLLVAGTTGSGKSVAINTMILSLLYRLKPQQCRLIMVDPKMLELSVYDGIPHLLTPVVTDPKKAVVALKWAVREMEDRYKKMSKLGVRNIDGFNARVTEAAAKGEIISRTVQTGFDRETGEAVYEQEQMDLSTLPFIVVIVDEMADLMMVAGKEIEGAIQRLAQMARAAGIHLIMATQRPSVDVITGTIKANFPTRISFQVTSKIDSRTILGEMGAEQLLGQGDMLYMAGGGRISRVHGPFVSDAEVERVVAHLKTQGSPEYLDSVTVEDGEGEEDDAAPLSLAGDDEGGDLYDRAVAVVLRDKKCSTSYVQRRLSVGYNKAASLVERMEKEGVVGPANHAGKRQILVGGGIDRGAFDLAD